MNCMLSSCAHEKPSACASLGACGVRFALDKASTPGGYTVLETLNPTVDELLDYKLVRVVERVGNTVTIAATNLGLSRIREAQ
jgi:hypothetical protein